MAGHVEYPAETAVEAQAARIRAGTYLSLILRHPVLVLVFS